MAKKKNIATTDNSIIINGKAYSPEEIQAALSILERAKMGPKEKVEEIIPNIKEKYKKYFGNNDIKVLSAIQQNNTIHFIITDSEKIAIGKAFNNNYYVIKTFISFNIFAELIKNMQA